MQKPKFIDLFCGCGGLSLGFKMSGFDPVAGIDFSGCTTAYAFAIGSFEKYPTSKSLADLNIQSAPQSFVYLDD